MPGTADAKDEVHRLRDIVVEEVSLVDRAANKRRFLVVKRSGEMLDGEDQELDETVRGEGESDAAGDDVAKVKKKPPGGDDQLEDEEKRKKPEADADETEKARRKAPADEEADAETEKAKDPADEDEKDDDEKERKAKALSLPAPLKGALLKGLTNALERLVALANRVKAAEEGDAEATLPAKLGTEMASISELLSGLCEKSLGAKGKAPVSKAGARMAKDRLDRFHKALSLLADILKELTDVKGPAPEPTAGSAAKSVAKQDAAPTPATVPGMAELVDGISELTKVVKRQEEELGRIRQTRGVSNAIQVDGGGRRPEPVDVSWPLDMNRPISREQVRKEVSFFDE